MIHLEKIDANNLWAVVNLKVKRSQKEFVAPNDASIMEAYVARGTGCSAFPFAIYNDAKPVGFLMIGFNEAAMYVSEGEEAPSALKNSYSLWRLMIDKRYQNRGYGREAIRLALGFIRTRSTGNDKRQMTEGTAAPIPAAREKLRTQGKTKL